MDKKDEQTEKADEEDAKHGDDEPSTSSGIKHSEKHEEMIKLWKETDFILEDKAKSMNLTSLNVRSILHHLIKFPSTIDVLLGIRENDDLPSVRNTRSKKNPTSTVAQNIKKFALRIEDKRPKTFLDVEYKEDDEFDDDYVDEDQNSQKDTGTEEDEDEEEEKEEEDVDDVDDEEESDDDDEEEEEDVDDDGDEEDVEHQTKTPEKHQKNVSSVQNDSLNALNLEEEDSRSRNITLNDTSEHRQESTSPLATLDTVVHDGEYLNFVKFSTGPKDEFGLQLLEDDEENDEDYNFVNDNDNLNVEDWDETRQDKTTMIPRHELTALWMDTLLAEKDIPVNVIPEEAIMGEEIRKSQKEKDAEVAERINTIVISAPTESCTLLKDTPVTFRPEEISILQMQLMQHVQLLTQFVVTCHHDKHLQHVRNSAQIMMNELDDLRQKKEFQTFLEVPNLDAAMQSCHEIHDFGEVDEDMVEWQKDTEENYRGSAVRPEAAAVLSRSLAIRFPALLPPIQPVFLKKPLSFLYQEDVMLAMALLQFAHLPRRSEKKQAMDRYTAIEKYCLPARTAYVIRNHLKTMRRVTSGQSPIHSIVQAAEKGICNLVMPQKEWVYCEGVLSTWPTEAQPNWLRMFHKKFRVTEDNKIHTKTSAKIVLTPIKKKKGKGEDMEDEQMEEVEVDTVEDEEEFVEVGKGPGGQSVVLDRQHLEELVMQLIKEKEISPSKRRKNSTPMKLSQLAELSHLVEENEEIMSMAPEINFPIVPSNPSAPMGVNLPSTSSESKLQPKSLSAKRSLKPICDSRPSTSSGIQNSSSEKGKSATPSKERGKDRRKPSDPQKAKRKTSSKPEPPKVPTPTIEKQKTSEPPPPPIEAPEPPKSRLQDIETASVCSFQIPLTPGRRTPDEDDEFMLDLESNSLIWQQTYSISMGNPRTPRGFAYSEEPDEVVLVTGPTDFSHLAKEMESDDVEPQQQQQQQIETIDEECTTSSGGPATAQRQISDSNDDEGSLTGFDLVPPYEEEEIPEKALPAGRVQNTSRPPLKSKPAMNPKASRKRTRLERETMGAVGITDENLISHQTTVILKKIVEDVQKRLFMHMDTWQQLKNVLMEKSEKPEEKYDEIKKILENHRELIILILLYAPSEDLPLELFQDPEYQNTKAAMEMIMIIERYVASAKLKEPSIKSVFRYIRSFHDENPNMTEEQAAGRFFQLLGQDRPLWNKLESNFWCLPFRKKPKLEQFEYVDLCVVEKLTSKREQREKKKFASKFESIDNIDLLMPSSRSQNSEKTSSLVVKCGELCIRNELEDTYTQLEVAERQWTRKDDITLITKFNEAIKFDPGFTEEDVPKIVPELQFGAKSVVARLKYLLVELNGTG